LTAFAEPATAGFAMTFSPVAVRGAALGRGACTDLTAAAFEASISTR